MKKKEPEVKKAAVPRAFIQWWEPWGHDKATGASIGGHEQALRMWSRPEPDRSYTRRMIGINVDRAWRCKCYRDEFLEWKSFGSPEREDFTSVAATLERQKEWWLDITPILTMIGKDERSKSQFRSEYKTDELIPKLLEKYAPT